MKCLYLRYLNLRLWLTRRRLRRRGLIALPPRLKTGPTRLIPTRNSPAQRLDYIKITIACLGLASMWLIFFLRQSVPLDPFSNVPSTPNHLTHHHE